MRAPRTVLIRAAAAVAAAALFLAACGDDDDDGAATTAPERQEVTITVVTHDSFNVTEAVLDAFTDETGVSVSLLAGGDAGAALNQAILTKDNPEGDVFFGVDNTFLGRALDNDLFVPYESPALADVDERFIVDPEHRVTPIDFGDVCLNYDKSYFEAAGAPPAPSSLEDLADPAYRGLTVVENPATSSPGLAFLLATIERFGDEGWHDYWSSLVANDVAVTDGWEDAYYGRFSGGSGEGDRPIVVSYASSPPAEVLGAPEGTEPPTAVVEQSCFRQIEFAGILRGTDHEEAAQQFIDFMLSPAFQEDMPLNMFVFPVNREAQLPELFTEHAVVPDDPFQTAPDEINENRDEWIGEWTDIVLR